MRKLLSMALAILLLVSCVSVGISSIAAATSDRTVTTSVLAQNGLNGGYVKGEATQTVAPGSQVTVEAVPYYGNTFEGWYDGTTKVSADAAYTFTADDSVALQAKFNIYNQVEDGSFEANNGEGAAFFNSLPLHDNSGIAVVAAVPAGSNAIHGNYVLQQTNTKSTTSNKYVLNIPVTLKKNTEYVFHVSYYTPTAYTSYLSVHADNGSYTNLYTASAKLGAFSYHWEKEGEDNPRSWSGAGTQTAGSSLTGVDTNSSVNAAANTWIDEWLVFNSGSDSSIFSTDSDTAEAWISFGVGNSATNTFYIDNVSFAEASASELFSVETSAGGQVQYNHSGVYTPESVYYFESGGVKTGTDIKNQLVADGTRYSQIVTGTGSYTATPDSGYIFTGWYKDGETTPYSMNATETFTQAGIYTAKFSGPPTAGEGGYLVDDGSGNLTAKPLYGNTFLGWYKDGTLVGSDVTVSATSATYADSVATFGIYNKATDGGFDDGKTNIISSNPSTGNVQEMTEANGNKYLRMTSTTASNSLYSFQWRFALEQDKKYIISYDMRPSIADDGSYLNSSGMSYRRLVLHYNGSGYDWSELSFTSKVATTKGSINTFTDTAKLCPPSGTDSYPTTGSTSYADNYRTSNDEWVNYSIVLDTTTAALANGTSIVNPDGTIDLGLILGASVGGTLALDIDNVLITEVLGEYEAVSANDTNGTVIADRLVATPGLPVTMTATAADGYAFYAWYNEQGTKVNTNSTITSNDVPAGKYTAKFVGAPYAGKGGTIVSEGNGVITATPYYGNKFDGWYDPDGKKLSDVATVNSEDYKGAEARFKIYNLIADGDFSYDASEVYDKPKDATTYYGSSEVKTDSDGNKYMELSTSTDAWNTSYLYSHMWTFKLEKDKKYIISYDVRATDESGVNSNVITTSASDTILRSMLLKHNGNYAAQWGAVTFASQKGYIIGSKSITERKVSNLTEDYIKLDNLTVSSYANNVSEWVNYSMIIDTSSAVIGADSIINPDGTIDLVLCFGLNTSGTLNVDLDNLVVSEVKNEYDVATESADKGTVKITRRASTAALDVKFVATPNTEAGYIFKGWYDKDGKRVSTNATEIFADGGKYTARFDGPPSASEGGYVVFDAGLAIAYPYYGNAFTGWIDKDGNPLSSSMSIDAATNFGAVAKFDVDNKASDGAFNSTGNNIEVKNPRDPSATEPQKHYNYTEILEEDGNKFIRLNSYWNGDATVSAGTRIGSFRYAFSLEKDKKYIISYKLRPSFDNSGANLNTAESFRRAIVHQDGKGGYDWKELKFASYTNYIKGSKNSLYEVDPTYANGFFLPSAGTYLNYVEGSGYPGYYSNSETDWVTYSVVVDTSTATFTDGTSIVNADGKTIDLYLTFGISSGAGVMALDLDDVLIAEVKDEYYAQGTDDDGNKASITNIASTKYTGVMLEAFPNTEKEYFFAGWYDQVGNLVNNEQFVSSSSLPAGTYTAKFAQVIAAGQGGTIINNYDGTYTAKAFYGNKFLGWMLGGTIVSKEATLESNASNKGVIATFTTDNLIFNGDFETWDWSDVTTDEVYQNYPRYGSWLQSQKIVVNVKDYMEESGPEYGENALLLTPDTSHDDDMSPVYETEEDGKTYKKDKDGNFIPVWETDENGNIVYDHEGNPVQKTVPATTKNEKIKGLLNIPVNLEAGKTYLWKLSYTYLANYDVDKHQLNFSVDKANSAGKPGWDNTVNYSYHSQLASYTNDKTDITKNVNDNIWSWGISQYVDKDGKEVKENYLNTKNASGGYEWVDLYVTFTAEEAGLYYLTLGTPATCVDNVLVDNISLTETFSEELTTVTCGKNGTIYSYRAEVPAFKATLRRGTGVFEENKPAKEGEAVENPGISVDKNKPMYAKMYVTYYAEPDLGYNFKGWYKGSKLVSTDTTLTVYAQGAGEYTAKFENDPNRYYLTAEVEKQDGVYGGYITSEKKFTDLLKYEKVTVSATAYDGNYFDGWYTEDGTRLSTKETYTYKVSKDTKLIAVFHNNNQFVDSGYENTKQNESVLGAGKEWSSDYSGAYGNAITLNAKKGEKSANLSANGYDIRHANMNVESNTIYHLAFNWMLSVANTEAKPATLEYVKVYNAATDELLAETGAVAAKGVDNWQKVAINFDTKDATSIYFVLKYKANIASIYVDELVLVNTDWTNFIVKAELETDGTVYPGYITGGEKQYAMLNNTVSISVEGYEGNVFLGWYKDGEKVSSDLYYEFPVTEFATYTAKFEIKNLIPDSGYENTKTEQSLSDLGLWTVKEQSKRDYGFDVFVSSSARQPFKGSDGKGSFEIYANTGSQMLRVNHRNNNFGTHVTGLKENTNYVFSFWWQIQNTGQYDDDTDYTAFFQTVKLVGNKTSEELGAGRAVGVGEAKEDWQKIYVPFNSGNNTEMDITLCYNTGSGYCFIDDFAVYEADYITLVDNKGGKIQTDFNGGVSGPAQRGEKISVTAVPYEGHKFVGWYDYGNPNKLISKEATYNFTVEGSVALYAIFEGPDAEEINWFIDGGFENYYMTAPMFDHPRDSTDWCSYSVTNSAGTIKPVSGNNFLRLNSHSRYTNFLLSNLEPATTYTVSFWYNTDAYVTMGRIDMFERYYEQERKDQTTKGTTLLVNPARNYSRTDSYGKSKGSINIYGNTNGEWQKAEYTFTTVNRSQVYMHIEYSRAAGSGSIYFDDIRIEKRSGGYTDTVVDGDFQTTTKDGGWIGSYGSVQEGENIYGVVADEIHNNINLLETRPYTVTFKARSAASAQMMFGVTAGGADSLVDENGKVNAFSGAAYDSVMLTPEWKEYTLNFTAAGFFQYSLFFRALDGEFDIDDVSVKWAENLVDAHKVTFEEHEKLGIYETLLQANNKTNPGNWQGYGRNQAYYEIYTDNAANIHSGSGSLVMHEEPNMDNLSNSQKTEYEKDGNYLSHPLYQSWSHMVLRPGKTYTISYWVKAETAGTQYTSQVVEVDNTWLWQAIADKVVTLDTTEWTKITQTFTCLETMNTHANNAYFVFNSIKGKTKGDIYFDDIEIVETANSVTNANTELLYTQDISQNYIENYSFEKAEGQLGAFSKTDSDAFYGEKVGVFSKGDNIIVPITTRTDYNIEFASEYTFAASIKGDASAKGYIALSYNPAGTELISDKNGNPLKLAVNTDGKWKRTGFTFTDFRNVTVYMVIVCEEGTFSLDYLAMFNENHSYDSCQTDFSKNEFDVNNKDNFVDMGTLGTTHDIPGTITGLPDDSQVLFVSDTAVYAADVDASGEYVLEDVANGTYDMYVAAGDTELMTLWGDITITPTTISGLACERLNADITVIEGTGVKSGIVKIIDDDTGWAYLTATNEDGEFAAYIGSEYWYVDGMTNDKETLEDSNITLKQFELDAAAAKAAANRD